MRQASFSFYRSGPYSEGSFTAFVLKEHRVLRTIFFIEYVNDSNPTVIRFVREIVELLLSEIA